MILISLITNNSYLHPLRAGSQPMHPDELLFILSHKKKGKIVELENQDR